MTDLERRDPARTFVHRSVPSMGIAAAGVLLMSAAAPRAEAKPAMPRSCTSMVALMVPGSGMTISKAEAGNKAKA